MGLRIANIQQEGAFARLGAITLGERSKSRFLEEAARSRSRTFKGTVTVLVGGKTVAADASFNKSTKVLVLSGSF